MAQKNFKVNNGLTTPKTTFLYDDGNTANTRTVNVSTSTASANYSLQLPATSGSLTAAVLGAVTLNSGSIDTIAITSGGSGYTVAPPVIIAGDGQFGIAHAVITNGVVTSIVIDEQGSGYTTATASLGTAGSRYLTLDNNSGNLSWSQISTIDLQAVNSAVLFGNNGVIEGNLGFTFNPSTLTAAVGCTAPGGQSAKFGYANITHQFDTNTYVTLSGETGITLGGAEDFSGTNPHAITIQVPQPTTGAWANYTLTLPNTAPNGNVLLISNANGYLSWVSLPVPQFIQNGNSNVAVEANANVTISSAGNANIVVVTGTGANITGTANVTGDILAGANVNVTSNINAARIQNGNSNIAITANANITLTAASNATMVISDTSANVTGNLNATANLSALQALFKNGDDGGTYTKTQIAMGHAGGTQYQQYIHTRHNAGSGADNAIDLYTSDGNATGVFPGNAILGLTVTNGKIGANITSPTSTLHVVGNANITSDILAGANVNVTANINAAKFQNGNSNIAITANSNVTIGAIGNANIVTVTGSNVITGAGVGIILTSNNGTDVRQVQLKTSTDAAFTANYALTLPVNDGTSGQVLTTDGSGVLSWATASGGGNSITDGNSNVVVNPNANVTISSAGNANILVVTGTGANVTGTLNVTGDLISNAIKRTSTSSNIVFTNEGNIQFTATSNITMNLTGTGAYINGTLVANGNVEVANNFSAANANVSLGTVANVHINGGSNLQFLQTDGAGNLTWAFPAAFANGNSNINIPAANGNVTISVGGNANVLKVTSVDVRVDGNILALGYFEGPLANGISNINMDNGGNIRLTANGNLIANITGTGANFTGYGNFSGNVSAANFLGALIGTFANGNSNVGIPAANGNVNISAVGNANILVVTGTGVNVAGTLNASGNANTGNLGTETAVITTGNITTINTGLVQNGNSNVVITANANITLTAKSNATMVISDTGANVTGTGNFSGNLTAANLIGTLASGNSNIAIAANANITLTAKSNATMTISDTGANITGTANVSGNANVGNLGTTTAIITTGNITTVNTGLVQNGNSNIAITANANVTITATSTSVMAISNTIIGVTANVVPSANVTYNLGNATNFFNNVYVANIFGANLANSTVDGTNPVGFKNVPVISSTANATTVLADAGKLIFHPSSDTNARTFTIAANSSVSYPIGTVLTFINMTTNVVTIAINSDTLYLAGNGATGSRSLAQYGMASAIKMDNTLWMINGTNLT